MLAATQLACERDDRLLFSGLDFSLQAGEILRVEGPNGAGKTTLLRMLAGLLPLRAGDITWKGVSVHDDPGVLHRNMLFLGHRNTVKADLTAIENLHFLQGLHQRVSTEACWRALEKVGLAGYEEVACRNLSAGQQRRVGLARLYLSSAPIWVLDEIFTAIDVRGVAQFEALLQARAREGGIVLLTTHHHLAMQHVRSLRLGRTEEVNHDH